MKQVSKILGTLGLALSASNAVSAATHSDAILERLGNANDYRNHIMVIAHRGLWSKDGKNIYPEGSLASVQKAIELGIEGVELDIRKSKDGQFFILHDDELDRTTTCTGSAKEKNMDELKKCQLKIVNDGEETITEETIPTLAELYDTIKGKILLNLDNKISYEEFPAMFELAKEHGVEKQILATVNQNTPEQRELSDKLNQSLAKYNVNLMPNLYDDKVDLTRLESVLKTYKPKLVQLRNAHKSGEAITDDGGIFFSRKSLNLGTQHNTHYWINTLYDPGGNPGLRSGGRGDEMAVLANLPDNVYGFWVDKGATIFQTDEPEALLNWLEKNQFRVPYTADKK